MLPVQFLPIQFLSGKLLMQEYLICLVWHEILPQARETGGSSHYTNTMKASDIIYKCPQTIAEALKLLSEVDQPCQPLAGGQSLMPMMNLRLAQPGVLLDLNRLPELNFIDKTDGVIHIGAMVCYSALLSSGIIRHHVPLFALALPHVAHKAVRNRGTIGGSTALADPAAEMPALLKALGATIVVISQRGTHEIAADDFFQGIYETALEEDELVHSIKIPSATEKQRFGFYELARRHGDYAMAGVAISAQSADPWTELRIVFFGVGDKALRATDAETALAGSVFGDKAALTRAQNSLSSLEYAVDGSMAVETRLQLAKVVLQRALKAM